MKLESICSFWRCKSHKRVDADEIASLKSNRAVHTKMSKIPDSGEGTFSRDSRQASRTLDSLLNNPLMSRSVTADDSSSCMLKADREACAAPLVKKYLTFKPRECFHQDNE